MGNSANITLLPCTLTFYPNPQMRYNSFYILVTELKLDRTVQTANPKAFTEPLNFQASYKQLPAIWQFQYWSLVTHREVNTLASVISVICGHQQSSSLSETLLKLLWLIQALKFTFSLRTVVVSGQDGSKRGRRSYEISAFHEFSFTQGLSQIYC